jgi:hypothetical protein
VRVRERERWQTKEKYDSFTSKRIAVILGTKLC